MNNFTTKSTLSLAVLLTATACTMAPQYTTPEMPVAATLSASEPSIGDQKSAAEISWQEFYKDPTLQNLINTALANNRDLRIAILNVESARALYGIQRADLIPSINANGNLTAQSTPENAASTGTKTTTRSYSANLASTAYELDLFGRVRSLNKAALEDWLATKSAQESTQISLIAEVANAYLQLLANTEIKNLTQETLAAQQKSQNLIQASYDNGLASSLDVAQVTQAVAAAKANLQAITRTVEQNKNALQLLLATNQTPDFTQTSLLNAKVSSVFAELPTNIKSTVLLQRPDVQQAEHTLKSMNANIGAARANFFPTISLTGSFGFASSELSNLFSAGSSGAWSFGPAISLPIFQGGSNWSNLRYSKAKKQIAIANYEKTVQTAFKEVADELAVKSTLSEQIAAQKELAEAAQKSYDLSYARYRQGIDRFSTVLDSQRALYAAQIEVVNLLRQNMSNHITLYKTLGGGSLTTN